MRRPAVYLLAIGVIVVDGMNWPIMSRGIEVVPPLWLATFRMAGAALVAGAIVLARGRLRRPVRADRPILLSVGLVRLAYVTAAVFVALRFVPPGRSSILVYTASLWTAPLAVWILHEALTGLRIAGLALGCAGIVCILEPWSLDLTDGRTLAGVGLLLSAAVAAAASAVHVRAHRWTVGHDELMPWLLAIAAFPLAVLAVAIDGEPAVTWTTSTVGIVAYQVFLGSVFALWGSLMLIRSVPAITANLLLMAVPVVGLSASVALVGEPLTLALLVGLALILAGVGLGLRSDHRSVAPAPTPRGAGRP
jgi:drug/metabolite transporter (DMT)-like permease